MRARPARVHGGHVTRADVVLAIEEILRRNLRAPSLVLERRLTARDVLGWDSIRMVDIILDIEDAFDIRIPATRLAALRDVGDMIDAVIAMLGDAATPTATD